MAIVTIIGSGMMGSALAFPARENGHEVRLVGTHLDREIIDNCKKHNRHPKFNKDFPKGIKFYQIEEVKEAIENSDVIIGGISSFGVDWFGDHYSHYTRKYSHFNGYKGVNEYFRRKAHYIS